ncbi:uncharacterized protein LOC108740130 [Agrilus planipennis]|uniref:Uncharacterized protein LOC108740130 n=1 Tax=Agrilus planipennis TaxID=224129 RepID=A0A1W4X135_AGRPL|nr:uncharacterized protein LOC108740130 [Agrilus planipennis]
MKAIVFALGFLTCLSFAYADSRFNTTAEEVRQVLQEIDPAIVSALSLTAFDRIKVSMTSASISDFSKFVFPVLIDDGSNVRGTFQLENLAANLNNLYTDHGTGIIGQIPQFDVAVGGINIGLNASYTTSPLRLTTLSSLLQLKSIYVSKEIY